VRSLELELERLLTTGTFNLVVKDPQQNPHWAAASDGTTPADTKPEASVLETFQTYHAIFGIVNRRAGIVNVGSIGKRRKLLKTRELFQAERTQHAALGSLFS